MTNITYVFAGNRKNKNHNNYSGPKEFFYGFDLFKSNEYNLEIIEPERNKSLIAKPLLVIDLFFKKIINLPVYLNEFVSIKNIKLLLKTDKLIFVNETTFCSLMFLVLFLKIFKKIDVYVFVMGLYSKKLRFPYIQNIHFFFIRVFISGTKKLFFLGQGELEKANKIHYKVSNKFRLFPFYIDTNFWQKNSNNEMSKNDSILFVGNDGNRDPHLFLKIVESLPDVQFTAVTNIKEITNSKFNNLNIVNKKDNPKITDEELRSIYHNSKAVILPLKESTQPSGQSVSLQAMSCGVPVIISLTNGFWDRGSFQNGIEIIFVENNSTEAWTNMIKEIIHNDLYLNKVKNSAQKLIYSKFNLDEFKHRLISEIN